MHDTRNVWFVVWGDQSDDRQSGRIQRMADRAGDVEGAFRFARAMVPKQRVLPVLLEQNRPWWERAIRDLPPENVTELPLDRGSAPGILAAAVRALCRDPDAILVLQCIQGVAPRRTELFRAIDVARREDSVVVLSRSSAGSGEAARVVRSADFEPSEVLLGEERRPMVVRASVLLDLYRAACPDLVEELGKPDVVQGPTTLDLVFPFLPDVDLLRHVLAPAERQLCLLA